MEFPLVNIEKAGTWTFIIAMDFFRAIDPCRHVQSGECDNSLSWRLRTGTAKATPDVNWNQESNLGVWNQHNLTKSASTSLCG